MMDDNDYNWDWWFTAAINDGSNGDIAIVIDEVMVKQKEQWWMAVMEMTIVIVVVVNSNDDRVKYSW